MTEFSPMEPNRRDVTHYKVRPLRGHSISAPSTCISPDIAIHSQSQAPRKMEFKNMEETWNFGLPHGRELPTDLEPVLE